MDRTLSFLPPFIVTIRALPCSEMPAFNVTKLGLVAALVSSASFTSAALVPRQSGAPTCSFECPAFDQNGNSYSFPYYPPSMYHLGCTYFYEVDGMRTSSACVYTKEVSHHAFYIRIRISARADCFCWLGR